MKSIAASRIWALGCETVPAIASRLPGAFLAWRLCDATILRGFA